MFEQVLVLDAVVALWELGEQLEEDTPPGVQDVVVIGALLGGGNLFAESAIPLATRVIAVSIHNAQLAIHGEALLHLGFRVEELLLFFAQ